MFENYFKTAWRNLLKNKGFSVINIVGLAIGMASALLIILWLQNMMSYDRFYTNKDRLYIMCNRVKTSDGTMHAWSWTPKILGTTLEQNYPEVEAMTRYGDGNDFLFTVENNKKIDAQKGAWADAGFFKMFSFKVLQGDANKALVGADKIVLTKSFASTLFGTANALGKTIKIDSVNYVTVSAIMQDLPYNTAFDFDYLLPWDYARKLNWVDSNWGNNSARTFVMLREKTNQHTFDLKVRNITVDHTRRTKSESPMPVEVFTQPFKNGYLYNEDVNGKYVTGRIIVVRLFAVIAGFILLIACINFMNLSTARSEKRAREVGVKKVIGATRAALAMQFITESILLAFIAFVIAVGLVAIVLPFYNQLLNRHLILPFDSLYGWSLSIAFILFTGLLAGSYPALYLSAFRPVKVLKGTFRRIHGKLSLRSVLVVLQFTFAIILIIATVIVTRQINHAENRDRGYDKRGIVFTIMQGNVEKNYGLIRNELLQSGAVSSVTKTMGPISQKWSDSQGFSWTGSTEADKKTDFIQFSADAGLVATTNMSLSEGRDIDVYKYPADSTAVLITEKAKEVMHLEKPIGASLQAQGREWHIVGVIKTFIIESPYDNIQPMIIYGPKSWFNAIHYKLNPVHGIKENLDKIEAIFKKYNVDYPFDYHFVDADYAKKFEEMQRIGALSALFAGLSIFISCLGLLGLIIFIAEIKTKEIGVRKVMGASVLGIAALLSREFLKLIAISFAIAVPVAWWAMHQWLMSYTYRVTIQWWWFLLTGVASLAIALATLSYHAIRAASANPVKSLRSE